MRYRSMKGNLGSIGAEISFLVSSTASVFLRVQPLMFGGWTFGNSMFIGEKSDVKICDGRRRPKVQRSRGG